MEADLASEQFWPWWVGGCAVALVALGRPLLTTQTLGVSTSYVAVIDRLVNWARVTFRSQRQRDFEAKLLAATLEAFGSLPAPTVSSPTRASHPDALFLGGLVLGALADRLLLARAATSLGRHFDALYGELGLAVIPLFLVAGVFLGFGASMSGGCTSGHGITGFSAGQRASLVSTLVFWAVGLVVAQLIWRLQ